MKKIILIPPCFSYGDSFSVISMAYYLLNHYEQVYFFVGETNWPLKDYYDEYFKYGKINKAITVITDPKLLISNGEYGEYHICNTYTHGWNEHRWDYYDKDKLDKEFYFNTANPLYNKINIDDNLIYHPNKTMPIESISINHLVYYEILGLNNNVRMDSFNYVRNLEVEKEYTKKILEDNGLEPNDKYNIINQITGHGVGGSSKMFEYIGNGYHNINLHYLAPMPGYLLNLIEGAEELHLIESVNTNFIYHCQYKNIVNITSKIFLHVWARNRNWPGEHMKLDYSHKMFDTPKLPNWEFIH